MHSDDSMHVALLRLPANARDGGEAGPEPAPGTSSLAGGQRAIVVVPGLVDCRFRGPRRNATGPPARHPRASATVFTYLCRRSIHSEICPLRPLAGGEGGDPSRQAMGRVRWAAPQRGTGSPTSPRPSPPPPAERENSERFLHSWWMCECRSAEAGTQGKRLKSLDSHLRRNDGMSDRSTHLLRQPEDLLGLAEAAHRLEAERDQRARADPGEGAGEQHRSPEPLG